jgi:hypothetical protein
VAARDFPECTEHPLSGAAAASTARRTLLEGMNGRRDAVDGVSRAFAAWNA